jgi:hypothetical protein
MLQPATHWSMSQPGPSHSIVQPPPVQLPSQQLASSKQTMRQPPAQVSIRHSAPLAQLSVQPPVGQDVVQVELVRQSVLQPPCSHATLQLDSSQASSQPPKQARSQEELWQSVPQPPSGQTKPQFAPFVQPNWQGLPGLVWQT